ncbi:MAG TPA: hypothetical protein VMF51_06325 [Nocardioides sp.]|uniref:hypothetical protein n=1 Tax=Nocardioides sp. TaxID=35761 RepID=UPI002C89520B|nr:hypothetical protein [Nocardioides sp.]HTW14725.1 hypothetical protein [Nocardioides sp.]
MTSAGTPELDPVDEHLLRLLSEGATLEVAARRAGLAERTARRRLRSLADAVGVDTTMQLVVHFVRAGVI